MFTLHCKPLYAPTDITPPNAYPTLARLRRHTYQTCLIIKPIPWGKSDRAVFGDAGIINRSFGWVNGCGMTKAHISTDQAGFVRALLLQMYESRLGLGVASFVIISVGIIVYSSGWLVLVFNGPIWLRRRLGRNNGSGLESRD